MRQISMLQYARVEEQQTTEPNEGPQGETANAEEPKESTISFELEEDQAGECFVCLSAPSEAVLLMCGHAGLCSGATP
jgi:hypothetical protein